MASLSLIVNGQDRVLDDVDAQTPLLWALRDSLGLVDTKYGCGVAQCEGAVIDGLSTMFGLEITIEAGRVQQSNYDRYPLLRQGMHLPKIESHFIQSAYPPTGIGEPSLPPVAPAICNAIFAASGQRVRTLPLTKSGYTLA